MNGRYTLTVSKDGNGSYMTIQEALDAVPYMVPATITVKEGIYREKLFSDKHDLVIRGEGKVLITFSDATQPSSQVKSCTLRISRSRTRQEGGVMRDRPSRFTWT